MQCGPAHRCRERMDAGTVSVLPESRILLERGRSSEVPHFAELTVQARIALKRQTLIPEHLRRRQYDGTVYVILPLNHGSVADAHGTYAAISGQRVRDAFGGVHSR